MRRKVIAGSVIAGTLAIAVAVPAVAMGAAAAATSRSPVTACDGTGPGGQGVRGPQSGGHGPMGGAAGSGAAGMAGRGPGGGGPGTATVTLTDAQRATIAAMAEEEKLAGDLYEVLGAKYDDATLSSIAVSEDRHLAAVRNLMARHGIPDPTAGLRVGEFTTEAVADAYRDLLARGQESLAEAHGVGVRVEEQDIADLTAALSDATAPDVVRVLTNLRAASQNHLAAFQA